jgi:hypothetical protein
MVETVKPQSVEFWFDPACPWCWMTSRWLVEVSEARGFTVDWHTLSLGILNEGKELDDDHKAVYTAALQALRVIEAARHDHGNEVVGKLYTEIGTRIHPEGRRDFDAILSESLDAVGLPSDLIEAKDADSADPKYGDLEEKVRQSTERALSLVGRDVGVPIISVDGSSFFGPVVTPAPTGDDALRLFDGIVTAASVEGFYELKRTRDAGPKF